MVHFSLAFLCCLLMCTNGRCGQNRAFQVNRLTTAVKGWSKQLGEELYTLSMTMTKKKKVEESFKPLKDKISYMDGGELLRDIAADLHETMNKKIEAVERISQYAEFLAFNRNTKDIASDENFYFYNSDNITNTSIHTESEKDVQEEIRNSECIWKCEHESYRYLPQNMFDKMAVQRLFRGRNCDCEYPPRRIENPEYFNSLYLKEDPNYGDTKVNFNLSVIKMAANIYERDQQVLQGIRWSEALDLVFKDNLKRDPTLKYQYFASPLGYMRHFPAVKWSGERYDQTYDPRTRSWYTEAMTSPKDIVILLDSSGSVCKMKRKIASHIVNNILDTLNDNDFVNIYIFANSTRSLVPCFENTLVQANEENLRLLRETLDNYDPEYQADISIGLSKAFDLLANFRTRNASSGCNQAIMLITEQAFLNNQTAFFNRYNPRENMAVRVFTYQLDRDINDARLLEWMACYNNGYFANVSLMVEVREKVLPYMNVMSRPINLIFKNTRDRIEPIWSYLYIDLADRRYTNWLWRKFEGNRQREIFLDHAKREFIRLQKVLTSESHFLLQETHEYEKYKRIKEYDYMTTLSLPVYGVRDEDVELVGVAGVDVPIKLLNSLIPHHKVGVNGYAFIVTNNGYILMHPGLRREFENIPKPTFNRVDLLEVEILGDTSEPRLFNESVIKLRDDVIGRQKRNVPLEIKFALDKNKRLILSNRFYYFDKLGPFSMGIGLPEEYGLMVVNTDYKSFGGLKNTRNWAVHPDWIYCKNGAGSSPEEVVLKCQSNIQPQSLLSSLLYDADATKWFETKTTPEEEQLLVKTYKIANVFMSTHSGLTRWKIFKQQQIEDNEEQEMYFKYNRSIDEDWYRRAVEENFNKKETHFIYSVPFEISGYESDTLITSTNAIFVKVKNKNSPVAVVGLQFNHNQMFERFNNLTKCEGPRSCNVSCDSGDVNCFVLDNNAYVVFSDEIEYTGRFIGDIIPVTTSFLVEKGVYKRIKMFDYQAICQKPPEEKNKSAATKIIVTFRRFFENLLHITDWALATIFLLITSVFAGRDYESTRNETLFYERLEINKTVPTPCDQSMWLFTLGSGFDPIGYMNLGLNRSSSTGCSWSYILEPIPHSNLLFLLVNKICEKDSVNHHQSEIKSPTPVEVDYNESLACYIATHNKFKRRIYTNCFRHSTEEDQLNEKDDAYCGHVWK